MNKKIQYFVSSLILFLAISLNIEVIGAQEIPRFKNLEVLADNESKQFATPTETLSFNIYFKESIVIESGIINFYIGKNQDLRSVSFSKNKGLAKTFQLKYQTRTDDNGIMVIDSAQFVTDKGLKVIISSPYVLKENVQIGDLFPEQKKEQLKNVSGYENSLALAHLENQGYEAREVTYINKYNEEVTVGIQAGKLSQEDLYDNLNNRKNYQDYVKKEGVRDQFKTHKTDQTNSILLKKKYLKQRNNPLDS